MKRFISIITVLALLLTELVSFSVVVHADASTGLEIYNPEEWETIKRSTFKYVRWNAISGAAGYRINIVNQDTGEVLTPSRNTWVGTANKYSISSLLKDIPEEDCPIKLKIWVAAMASKTEGDYLTVDGTNVPVTDLIQNVIVADAPTYTNYGHSNVTSNSATLSIKIIKNFGSPILDAGFLIGTSSSRGSADVYSFADYGGVTNTGTMTMTVRGLKPNTKYYYWSYCENEVGKTMDGKSSYKTFTTSADASSLTLSDDYASLGWQSTSEDYITVSTSNFSYSVDYPSAAVNSNYDYEWLTCRASGNRLYFKANRPNYSSGARSVDITVTSGDKSAVLTVEQDRCGEGAPSLRLRRGSKNISNGDTVGSFGVPQSVMEFNVDATNIRKMTAFLETTSGTRIDRIDKTSDFSMLSFNISSLKAGDYKITVYASNSNYTDDYWAQRPFSSLTVYFSLTGGSIGGSTELNIPTTASEANKMVIYSPDKKPKGVVRGMVRHVPQVPSDDFYCKEYWADGGYDTSSNSGSLCTRAVYSMALSYLGVDCTPGRMAQLMGTIGDIETVYYDNVTKKLQKTYPGLSLAIKGGKLSDLFDNYAKKSNYSPVYVRFGAYGKSAGHAALVIGRDKSNPNKYYCVEPSYSGTGSSTVHVVTMVVNSAQDKATEYTWASCRGRSITACFQWSYSNGSAPAPHTHTWNNGTVTKQPTCTTTGIKSYTCSCGETKTESVAAKGHTPGAAATCTAPQKCTVCGTQLADATGHKWNSGTVTKQPTCIATGVKTYTCSSCGTTRTESIAAKEHTPGPAATCTSAQKCTVCGTQLASPTDHKFDNGIISKEPTCLDDGVKTYTCFLCGETKTEPIISGKRHTPGAAATCTTPQKCTVCGTQLAAALGHNYSGSYNYSAHPHEEYQKCTRCNVEKKTGSTKKVDSCSICYPTFTITYNANGGTGEPASQTKTSGKALTLSSTKPTRQGYTFLGWATSSGASSAQYNPGSSFTTDANTTLYAVWRKDEAISSDINFELSSSAAAPGSTVELTLKVTGTTKVDFITVYDFVYDKSVLEFQGISEYGDLVKNCTLPSNAFDNDTMSFTMGYVSPVTASGKIAILRFKVKNSVPEKDVTVSYKAVATKDRREVESSAKTSVISISKWLPGDFNDDGIIDMKDSVRFIGWVGAPFLPQFQINHSFNADFNKDGRIDMKDAAHYIGWVGAPFLPQFKIDW